MGEGRGGKGRQQSGGRRKLDRAPLLSAGKRRGAVPTVDRRADLACHGRMARARGPVSRVIRAESAGGAPVGRCTHNTLSLASLGRPLSLLASFSSPHACRSLLSAVKKQDVTDARLRAATFLSSPHLYLPRRLIVIARRVRKGRRLWWWAQIDTFG